MARLEGKKPNAGAIIIGAIIFSLAAAGLFFAFRPVPEPTDAGLSNATSAPNGASTSSDANAADANAADANAAGGESSNSLTTILTPLPLATPTLAPLPTSVAQTDGAALTTDNSAPTSPTATDNSAPPAAATAPVAAPAVSATAGARVVPMATPSINVAPTPLPR